MFRFHAVSFEFCVSLLLLLHCGPVYVPVRNESTYVYVCVFTWLDIGEDDDSHDDGNPTSGMVSGISHVIQILHWELRSRPAHQTRLMPGSHSAGRSGPDRVRPSAHAHRSDMIPRRGWCGARTTPSIQETANRLRFVPRTSSRVLITADSFTM